MHRVVWLDEAADQLDTIVAYIELFDPAAADRIAKRLLAVADSLAYFPQRGRPSREGSREMVTVPPYILRYDVHDGIVYILGVRHGARRPD